MFAWDDIADWDGPVDLGATEWTALSQERVDLFARATGDFQFLHVDPERAQIEGPFGGTVVHGYHLLSMAPVLLSERITFPRNAIVVNYGLEKLRFSAPVRVGQRFRGRFVVTGRNRLEPTKTLLKVRAFIEVDCAERPVVSADPLIALVRVPPESKEV